MLVRTARLALLALLFAVPTANASTASLSSSVLVFQGDPDGDGVQVTRSAPYYYVVADGINPGTGCSRYEDMSSVVRCRDTGNQRRFALNTGGGNDSVSITGDFVSGSADLGPGNDTYTGRTTGTTADVVHGGDGDDILRGGTANDALFGDAGNDQVAGQGGDDGVDGGTGDDQLEFGGPAMAAGAGSGADDVHGGPGTDRTSYLDRGAKVSVSLDDLAGDGVAAEGDNVHGDMEVVVGSELDDALAGNDGGQQLFGNAGFDRIDAGGGDDLLNGGTGDDELYGGPGRDRLEGSAGEDYLEGGAGDDLFEGDNVCTAQPCTGGSDFIQARDGEADTVNCGVGADTALVDDIDVVAQDSQHGCERIDRAAAATVAPPPAAGALGDTAAAAVPRLKVVGVRKLGTLRRGKFRIEVTCGASCRVKARLIAGRTVVASRTKTRLGAGVVKLSPKLSKKGRKALRRRSRVRTTLAVDVTDAQGTVTTLARVLTFRRG
jgi:hypothetical protein